MKKSHPKTRKASSAEITSQPSNSGALPPQDAGTPSDSSPAPAPALALAKPADKKGQENSFPIVAIGASAGGLSAIEKFFSAMPTEGIPPMAFVVVQHLSPDHKSLLSDLVKRYTSLGVVEVEDGMAVQPGCVYVIPPNRDMSLLKGQLHLLTPNAPRGLRMPIDFFFRSLAQDLRDRAICIILSGTGSDGTLGLRAIKAEGGMAMVQTPETAEYDGMPQSAIASGMIDYVSSPAEMPGQLIGYVRHANQQLGKPESISLAPGAPDNSIEKIHSILRSQTGHDFSHYKRNTIDRRIQRRMAIHQISHIGDYVAFLIKSPEEVNALFQEFLIGVTSFFRDSEVFEVLAAEVIPSLFKDRIPGATVRVWVPGCSTGEEAYSLAILLQEHISTLKKLYKVQIFATDIDSRAIDLARAGVFSPDIPEEVSEDRLGRFFSQVSPGAPFRIQKSIRDMLVFSEHDLIKDPPFSRVDLISCRNLLIYMDSELQQRVIPLFHYALNPGGYLLLGTSESVGDFTDLFSTAHRKEKIFRRKDYYPSPLAPSLPSFLTPMAHRVPHRPAPEKSSNLKISLRELIEGMLLRQFSPPAALVNHQGDILYLHGRTGNYLEPSPGEAGVNNILEMAREGMRRPLSTALHKAAVTGELVCVRGVRVRTNGHFTRINLTVQAAPLPPMGDSESALFLVLFEKVPEPEKHPAATPDGGKAKEGEPLQERLVQLEQELRAKEEYIKSTKEELETSNEELKSSNEEMQSINEELQSTNEELETAKEESQSVNEELATVNTELQTKVADLSKANNDMNNLLAGTGLGTIFVDHQQRIQRFTPSATEVISLIATDVGRPLGHIVSNLVNYSRLNEDIQAVLDTLLPKETEVQTKSGTWYLLGIRPYRTLENVIEGAVITFVNITELKKSQADLQATEWLRHLAALLCDSRDAIIVQNLEGTILAWNPTASKQYGWSEDEATKMNLGDTIPPEFRANAMEQIRHAAQTRNWEPIRMQRLTKEGRCLDCWVTSSALVNAAGEVYAIMTMERIVGE